MRRICQDSQCTAGDAFRVESDLFDYIATINPNSCPAPLTVCHSFLVRPECSGIAKPLVDLPHERFLRRIHLERNAPLLGTGQLHMKGKVLHHDCNLVSAITYKLPAQKNIVHQAIFTLLDLDSLIARKLIDVQDSCGERGSVWAGFVVSFGSRARSRQ